MKDDERRPVDTILNRSDVEIIRDLVESKERSKSPEEKARERKIDYHSYVADRRREENEVRYGKRRTYLTNRRR